MKELQLLCKEMRAELYNDIFPFWTKEILNPSKDGFWSTISNDLQQKGNSPKSVINYTRLLWSYSAWYRFDNNPVFLELAEKIYIILEKHFWDSQHKGVVWALDEHFEIIDDKKRVYGHSFFIYALTEYYAASGHEKALELAKETFDLLCEKVCDKENKGYFETFNRDWTMATDLRLSDKDMNEKKSMNTHLHVMEAFANLYRVWPHELVRKKLYEVITIFIDHIIEPVEKRFKLFFDEKWVCKSSYTSFGHDIEGSWLLWEAAEVLGDPQLLEFLKPLVLQMAQRVLDTGVDADGGVFYEGKALDIVDSDKHWWPQAEAIVGFINAWQLSGNTDYANAAIKNWKFVQQNILDQQYGEWYWRVTREGKPYMEELKVTDWKGPYHNSRACIEIIKRLEQIKP